MTRARTLADMISDGVIGTTELADDAITPVKLDETGNYTVSQFNVNGGSTTTGLNLSHSTATNTATNITFYTTNGSAIAEVALEHSGHGLAVGNLVRIDSSAVTSWLTTWGIFDLSSIAQEVEVIEVYGDSFFVNITCTSSQTSSSSISQAGSYPYYVGTTTVSSGNADFAGIVNSNGMSINGSISDWSKDYNVLKLGGAFGGTVAGLTKPSGQPYADLALTMNAKRTASNANSALNWKTEAGHSSSAIVVGANGSHELHFYTSPWTAADTSITWNTPLKISDANVIFNDDSKDLDFRIESDGNTHALFVDAGNDSVHFGTSGLSSGAKFEVNGNGHFEDTSDDNTLLRVKGGTQNLYIQSGSVYGGVLLSSNQYVSQEYRTNQGDMKFSFDNGTTHNVILDYSANTFRTNNIAAVFNETGADKDFRIESDTNNTIFFVDAGANRIGIKNNTPTGADLNFDSVATNPSGDTPSGAKISFYGNNNDHLIGVDNEGAYHTTNTAWKVIAKSGSTYSGEMFTLNTSSEGAVFNDNSYNRNFRVESDSFSNAFIVDADTNLIGFVDVGTAPWAQTSGQGLMTYRLSEGSMALSNNGTNGYAGLYINKFNAASDNRAISFYREGGTEGHIRLDATQGVKYGTSTNGGVTSTTELNKLGITFDGGSNYLDDYEEGTWDARPSTSQSSVVPLSGWNVNAYSGSYVKIGRLVICQYYFDWTNTNSSSSTLYLKLPFQVNGTTNQWSGNGTETSNTSFPSGASYITVRPENLQAHASFKGCGNNLSRVDMQFNHFGGNGAGYALGSFVYMTA